jgi:hypothetical protein
MLPIKKRGYDYYWRERHLLTSAPRYVGIPFSRDNKGKSKHLIFDIRCGLMWDGKTIFKFPWSPYR